MNRAGRVSAFYAGFTLGLDMSRDGHTADHIAACAEANDEIASASRTGGAKVAAHSDGLRAASEALLGRRKEARELAEANGYTRDGAAHIISMRLAELEAGKKGS